jgi:hypothetical protein
MPDERVKNEEQLDEDELLEQMLEELANAQLRANYRKSLGREYVRRSWDLEIKRAIKKDE